MPNPDDAHDAQLLIRQLRDAGVGLTVSAKPTFVMVHATDIDGQVYYHARDDGDLLAAVCEVAERVGYAFI